MIFQSIFYKSPSLKSYPITSENISSHFPFLNSYFSSYFKLLIFGLFLRWILPYSFRISPNFEWALWLLHKRRSVCTRTHTHTLYISTRQTKINFPDISFVTLIPKAAFVYLGFPKTAEYFIEESVYISSAHAILSHYIYPLSYQQPEKCVYITRAYYNTHRFNFVIDSVADNNIFQYLNPK